MHNWWIVLSKHLHAGLTRQRREDRPWEAPRTRRSPRVYGMYRWPAASCLQVGQIKGDSEGPMRTFHRQTSWAESVLKS